MKDLRMKYTLLITALCFLILSCEKNKDSNSSADKTQQLTSGDWKYDNGGIGDANGNILVDFSTTGTIPACTLDNTIRFNSNNSGTISENTMFVPMLLLQQHSHGVFKQRNCFKRFSRSVAGIGGSFRIKELSGTRLSLLKDTTVTGFGAVTASVNLKH
jgi:hypothetical protein